MPIQSMLELAVQMLEATNPYEGRGINEIRYTGYDKFHEYGEHSLFKSLQEDLEGRKPSRDARYAREINCSACYEAIMYGMSDYLQSFPAQFSVKKQIKQMFVTWLQKIRENYPIDEYDLPENLKSDPGEMDPAVLLIKSLHSREGASAEELMDVMNLKSDSPRGLKKELRRLDPSLCETQGQKEEQEKHPYRIGGQPVHVKISRIKRERDRKYRYKTVNTLHPIVLQENLIQAGTLLQALSRNYNEPYQDEISFSIAAEIWFQLSEYAQEKIRNIFGARDPDFVCFVNALARVFPDSQFAGFQTEREQMKDNISIENLLDYTVKVSGRRCNLTLHFGDQIVDLENQEVDLISDPSSFLYMARGEDGQDTFFNPENIDFIESI